MAPSSALERSRILPCAPIPLKNAELDELFRCKYLRAGLQPHNFDRGLSIPSMD